MRRAVAPLRAAHTVLQPQLKCSGAQVVLEVAARADPGNADQVGAFGRRHFAGRAHRIQHQPAGLGAQPLGQHVGGRCGAGPAEQGVDQRLVGTAVGFQGIGARGERLQLRLQLVELERLDQIVRRAAVERAATVSSSRAAVIMMTPTRSPVGSQPLQHLQAGHIGKVDVQQDQMRPQFARRRQRLGTAAGDADGSESVDPFDESAVDLGDHEIVVDDQDVTHGRPVRRRRRTVPGNRTTNSAPPPGAVDDFDGAAVLGGDQAHQRQARCRAHPPRRVSR